MREVSLAVADGELLTLLGPSGCGKSTTLRMIAGFEEPDEGTILIGGRDVTHVLPNKRGIGFVFQNYALFPHLTVFENVAYGLRVQGRDGASVTRAVGEVLELVGLARYERQQPHQLSGGEQQRVALARAVVFEPQVPVRRAAQQPRPKLRVEMRERDPRAAEADRHHHGLCHHDQEEAMAISDRIASWTRAGGAGGHRARNSTTGRRTEFVAHHRPHQSPGAASSRPARSRSKVCGWPSRRACPWTSACGWWSGPR